MALRVLLADESHTIKKVFQLALQDYAVEVRPVNVGSDVLSVAKSFHPDIIFADVLLQKKSGYEVCAEIKGDSELQNTPVILMWSGFMEVDDDKVQASRANAKLEKPFDVNTLRKLVHDHVPKTKTQKLSGFLKFPDRPDFEESAPPPPPPSEGASQANWNMESFDPMESPKVQEAGDDFQALALTKPEEKDQDLQLISDSEEEVNANWTQQSLNKFKVSVDEANSDNDVPVDYLVPEGPLDVPRGLKPDAKTPPVKDVLNWKTEDSQVLEKPYVIDQASQTFEYRGPTNPSFPGGTPIEPRLGPTPEQIQKLVEERAQTLIEEAVWKIVPELASRMIERELQRLLSEKEA